MNRAIARTQLVELTRRQEDAATELLARAFLHNPPHVCIFPDHSRRLHRMRWLMRRVYRGHLAGCDGIGLEVAGKLQAMAFLQPPGGPSLGWSRMLRHGLLAAPSAIGLGATRRALTIQATLERRRVAALRGREAQTLFNVAVSPERQGQGLGSDLLRQAIKRITPACVALDTQTPENVRFYLRLGFRVVDKARIEISGGSFDSWVMLSER